MIIVSVVNNNNNNNNVAYLGSSPSGLGLKTAYVRNNSSLKNTLIICLV